MSSSSLWWKGEGAKVDTLWSHIRALETRHRTRTWRDYVNERIYGSSIGLDGIRQSAMFDQLRQSGFMPADLNFTRTIVDALVARVANDRPAIRFSADGAAWSQRRKAKQFDKVIEGNFEALSMKPKMALTVRDALVTRGGAVEVEADSGEIVADRVPCEEYLFDDREARYGDPRQLHRVMRVAKEVLADKFSEHRGKIEDAAPPPPKPNDLEVGGDTSNMIEVAKSWHLPSSKNASDGRRVISIPGQVLLVEPWKRPTFPVAFLRWAPPRRGFWGSSLVDELAALQFKVNEVAKDLMQNIYFTSAVKVAVRRGADISKKHVAGKKPHYIDVDAIGADLQWIAPDGFSPAQFQFLQWLIQQMFEVSGVSQLMAQGKNPLGAGASGAALNEVHEQDSERFSQFGDAISQCWCDAGRLTLEAAQDLAEDEGFRKSEVRWNKGNVQQRIAWSEVDLDADRFELHLEAAGFMPQARAGKMQAIEQLIAAGLLDPKWATSLIEFPDLKQAMMIQNAPVEWALWAMGKVADAELNEDETEVIEEKSAPIPAPDPHIDLKFVMAVAKAVYQQRMTEEDPPPILRRYLDFIDAVDVELSKASPAALGGPIMAGDPAQMAGAPPMPVDPMAGGMPPAPMPMMGAA